MVYEAGLVRWYLPVFEMCKGASVVPRSVAKCARRTVAGPKWGRLDSRRECACEASSMRTCRSTCDNRVANFYNYVKAKGVFGSALVHM